MNNINNDLLTITYLAPSWNSPNSTSVVSNSSITVTIIGSSARDGNVPLSLTSIQSLRNLQMSIESKYLPRTMMTKNRQSVKFLTSTSVPLNWHVHNYIFLLTYNYYYVILTKWIYVFKKSILQMQCVIIYADDSFLKKIDWQHFLRWTTELVGFHNQNGTL